MPKAICLIILPSCLFITIWYLRISLPTGRLAPMFKRSPSLYQVRSPPPAACGFSVDSFCIFFIDVSSIAVLYDPDFGVVLQGSSDTSSSSSGSGDNLLPLLSLIALVIPLAFVLLAIVILSIMGVKAWKYRQHQSQIKHSVQL